MQLHLAIPRIAVLTIVTVLGSIILQPTTLRAASEGVSLSSAEPPSTLPSNMAPEVYQGSFQYTHLGDMLRQLNLNLNVADQVTSFPDPSLGIGSQIRVYRAPVITIDDADTTRTVHSWAKTVGQLATEQRLALADLDLTSSPLTAPLPSRLKITRVSQASLAFDQVIPFTTTYSLSAELEKGVQQVKQTGQDGILQQTYQLKRENGIEVSRTLGGSQVIKAPRTQLVLNGTKVTDYGSGGASWYGGVAPLTAAHKTLPKGTKVSVVNLANGKSVTVTIDDRGPFVGGRVIDLSPDAFAQIADLGTGVVQIRMDKVYPK